MKALTIIPWLNNFEMTLDAVVDAQQQEAAGAAHVLVVGNGVKAEDRDRMEKAVSRMRRVMAWFHSPALPSLSATWNRALDFAWATGHEDALVCNNDVRLTPDTYTTLRDVLVGHGALMVTATGVEGQEGMFAEAERIGQRALAYDENQRVRKGGPGFSCFLISKECHQKYRFDEALTPAYCEDVDYHRQMILGGDGDRIYGTNVRYLHLGGQTLLAMNPEERERVQHAISAGSRAHFARKWGGGVNEEKNIVPWQGDEADDAVVDIPAWIGDRYMAGQSVGTIALFEVLREKW